MSETLLLSSFVLEVYLLQTRDYYGSENYLSLEWKLIRPGPELDSTGTCLVSCVAVFNPSLHSLTPPSLPAVPPPFFLPVSVPPPVSLPVSAGLSGTSFSVSLSVSLSAAAHHGLSPPQEVVHAHVIVVLWRKTGEKQSQFLSLSLVWLWSKSVLSLTPVWDWVQSESGLSPV